MYYFFFFQFLGYVCSTVNVCLWGVNFTLARDTKTVTRPARTICITQVHYSFNVERGASAETIIVLTDADLCMYLSC